MPVTTSAATLAVAIASKRTKTTKRLDALFGTPGARNQLKDHEHYAAFKDEPGHLNTLDPTCQNILALNNAEVQHINAWDNAQKESVRRAMVTSIDDDRRALYFWEVAPIPIEETIIIIPSSGDIRMTFRTPDAFIEEVEEGIIQVGVGEPP